MMFVQNVTSTTSPRVGSVSRRFSYTLIGVVTLLLTAFAAVGIFLGVAKIENELKTRLDNAIELALKGLSKPLWNMDYDLVNEFVEALFLDESIVYTKISWGDKIVAERKRPSFKLQHIQLPVPHGSEFIAKTSDIFFETNKVAEILIVMSREGVKKQVLLQVYGTIALTLLIIAAIWVTSIVITKRYISRPLLKLQQAASLIARGDLDALVDKSSSNEIGVLGQHLDAMRTSIKQLFEELSESKERLEEYSRTLEQKVEERTQELAWSVEQLERNVKELEQFSKLAVGREIKMIQLKKEINELLCQLGQVEKYEIVE
jgi:methyl-accepting chemotaxis protein